MMESKLREKGEKEFQFEKVPNEGAKTKFGSELYVSRLFDFSFRIYEVRKDSIIHLSTSFISYRLSLYGILSQDCG